MSGWLFWCAGWIFTDALLGQDKWITLFTWPADLGKWVKGKFDE